MSDKYIKYRSGYKYQTVEEYQVKTNIRPDCHIDTDYISLTTEGVITIRKGYAWDGPSGPTIDTRNFMRGSLVHDALYQLLREEEIGQQWRDVADRELQRMCREDGMSSARASLVYKGVHIGGKPSASPESRKKVYRAP